MILDIGRKYYILDFVDTFLDSSMVEHSAVNRVVVGSSPTRGAVGVEGLPFLFIRDLRQGAPDAEPLQKKCAQK